MAVRSYQEPNGAAGERAGRVRGIRLWLRAYLVGLLLLLFAAAGTLAHLTIKHPPPPGISLGRQLEFVLALTVFEVGYQAQALRLLGGLARQGHSGAAFLAGFIYDTGNGVAEDPREAAR